MAMNKKEQAAFEELRKALAVASAGVYVGEPVKRDVPPPKSSYGNTGESLSRGWDANSYSDSVRKACSSSVHHGNGWEKTSNQNPLWLYSTELLALKALRYEVAKQCAERLAKIDMQIAAKAKEQA